MADILSNSGEGPGYFPYQKRRDSQKNDKFFKECVDAGINIINHNHNYTNSSTVRSPRHNKITNYRVYNGDIDAKEVEAVVNPFKIQFADMPSSYKNYAVINPNINVLVGEERKRFFKPMFINVNEDAVTTELEKINEELVNATLEVITSGAFSEEEAEKTLKDFEKWRNFHLKDKNARMAGQVIEYLYRTLDLKEEFSRGFEDLLIAAEEIYITDIVGGEPIMRKANPLNIFTFRSGESYKIEDSDVIIEDGYLPIGEVIDRFYDELKPSQIEDIEKSNGLGGPSKDMFSNQLLHGTNPITDVVPDINIGRAIAEGSMDILNFGGSYDSEGNVRVTRVLWKGMREIGIKEYWDEVGNYVREFVSGDYEADLERGEDVKKVWVSEWLEGTKIAGKYYVKMGPREVQMRSMDNPSRCHPGIVGSVMNVNNSTGKSLVDSMKVYQYLYNAIMYRTEMAIAKYLGKVGKVNASLIPDGWSMDQFLYYMYTMNIQFEDPFNEGQEGVAKGKLAGSMNQGGKDTEIGDPQFIQQHLMLLEFIQRRIDEITGVTPQRKGSIDNRETVGGVERSVMQSSHITEKWFSIHDDTKKRALLALLETAKVAWKDKSFKRIYILDDGTKGFLDFNGAEFKTTEFGAAITTDSDDMNMMQAMKQLSQHLVQNQAPLSLIMELYRTKDPESLKRKLEQFEEKQAEQMQAQVQADQEALQAQLQQTEQLEMMRMDIEQQDKELDRELEQYKIDRDNETKLAVAQINAYIGREDLDANNDGIPDPMQISEQALKRMDIESKHYEKDREIKIKEEDSKRKKRLEEKKMELEEKRMEFEQRMKDKELRIKEKDIAAKIKIAKTNRNSYSK